MSDFFARLAARAAGAAPQAAIAPAAGETMSRQLQEGGTDPFEITATADAVVPAPSHPAAATVAPVTPVPTLDPVSHQTATPLPTYVAPPALGPRRDPRPVPQRPPEPEPTAVAERETGADLAKSTAEPQVVADRPVALPPRERFTPNPPTIVVRPGQPPPIASGERAAPRMRPLDSGPEPTRVEPRIVAAPAVATPREDVPRAAPLEPPEATRPAPMPAPPEPPRLVIGRMRVDVIPTAPPAPAQPAVQSGERRSARGGVSARGSSLHVGLGQM